MFRLLVCATVAAATVGAGAVAGPARAAAFCPGTFSGTVTHGPDQGFVLAGSIEVSVGDKGALSGSLTRADGSVVPLSGKLAGKTLHLAFDLGDAVVTGSGGAKDSDFATCTGTAGGGLHGPAAPDGGDWGIIWGSGL